MAARTDDTGPRGVPAAAGTDVAARTLRLLTLLQARPSWSAAELAARTGTSGRTLRRDVRRLGALGYEVVGRPGPGGHYRLAPGTRLPPLVLDDDEVVALVAGLRMVQEGPLGDAATRALVTLRQVLPRRLAAVAREVAEHSEAVTLDATGPDGHGAALLGRLTAAAAAGRAVELEHTDAQGTTRRRRLESVRCLLVRGRWLVLGYDVGRDDWRVLRLDRVGALEVGEPGAVHAPPAADLAAWLASDFGRAPGG